jgi:Fe-S cluster biogenesis protein NfuA
MLLPKQRTAFHVSNVFHADWLADKGGLPHGSIVNVGNGRMSVCLESLATRISDVNALMSAHAGAVELLEVGADGSVLLRFTGKCSGCELKAVTMAGTVRPALLAVQGVTQVLAAGTRISEEAAQRIAESLGTEGTSRRWLQLIHDHRGP